MGKDLHIF